MARRDLLTSLLTMRPGLAGYSSVSVPADVRVLYTPLHKSQGFCRLIPTVCLWEATAHGWHGNVYWGCTKA